MPDERGKAKPQLPKSEINELGQWPLNLQVIRERLLKEGVPPDEVEVYINEIKEQRDAFKKLSEGGDEQS